MRHQARIKTSDNRFMAYVVRVDYDGEEDVVSDMRSFASQKAAEKFTARNIAKLHAA